MRIKSYIILENNKGGFLCHQTQILSDFKYNQLSLHNTFDLCDTIFLSFGKLLNVTTAEQRLFFYAKKQEIKILAFLSNDEYQNWTQD